MLCIHTRYIGPSNKRGPRIVAKCYRKRIVVSYDHAATKSFDGPHHAAAMTLANQLGWEGKWHFGGDSDGSGNVYVLVDDKTFAFETEAVVLETPAMPDK